MKVGIIGGGTMGLALAHRLARQGCAVTVLEAAPQVGGLATWFDYGDFVWDKFYHVICRSDSHLLGLIDELGIGDKVKWSHTRTGFLWRGKVGSAPIFPPHPTERRNPREK
ncbi:FAD-dependent oxidoreductase [bacterium]|nr:FAD-dependent oxidoreductase [bacterium]